MTVNWDRIRGGAGVLFVVSWVLFWLDGMAFAIVAFFIGGTFLHGEVGNGKYFLAFGDSHDRHPLTQVSEQVYNYSVYHHLSMVPLVAVAGMSIVVFMIASNVSRERHRLEVRVTSGGIALNGQPVSIAGAVDALREANSMARCGHVINDYEASEAPRHAVAFQLELVRHKILLEQEPPRWKR